MKKLALLFCLGSTAMVLAGCKGLTGELSVAVGGMQAILPSFAPEKTAALRAEIKAGDIGGATVGVSGCDYPDIVIALRDAPPGVRRLYLMDRRNRVSGLSIRRDIALIGFGA